MNIRAVVDWLGTLITTSEGSSARVSYIRRYVIAALICLPTLLALLFLIRTPPQYTANMIVTPNLNDPRTLQNNSRMGGLARSIGLGVGGDDLPGLYAQLLNKLSSPAVAEQLLLHHPDVMKHLYGETYDAKSHSLIARPGLGFYVKQALTFGRFHLKNGGAGEVSQMLGSKIQIKTVGSTSMRQIAISDSDSDFAVKLLGLLFVLADDSIKHDEAVRAKELHAYLLNTIKATGEVASIDVARAILEQNQSQLVLSTLTQPMTAQVVEAPIAGAMPSSPHYGLTAMLGLSISLFFAIIFAYFRYIWVARQDG